ncbi:L-carnitine dehydratase/bile acid-inducible protein F [Burkholderia gladioli]|uniref:CaiB/BaiF CoA transferase family protein n=1 Tax=Burkholderia gladioli TaxID=28095 RepID=UPI001CAF5D43|nr:CoA transferase [Burkholderia gladioli]CAG9192747.1 L-carnitine dehydratase/bile acid-inducible protein F [Burkholderia gladioli]
MLTDSLAGVRVLDFSHVLAGPVCSMTLADLGAEVVKIEPPDGELGRKIGPPWIQGESATFMSVNRNKLGVSIDLKTEAGRRLVRKMLDSTDVLVENFRPGVMKSMGFDYDSIRAAHPRIVYCSISAFGQHGSHRRRPGVDGVIQAASGLMSTLGTANEDPLKVPVPIADMIGGYLASIGILGALHRVRDGKGGQHLDISLYNATVMLQQTGFAAYFATGRNPDRLGSAAPYAAPNEAFPSRDGWIMVVAYHPARWAALCDELDMPWLVADARFASNALRVRNRAALHELLAGKLAGRPTAEWMERLASRDIMCAPIVSYDEVVASDEYAGSGLSRMVDHPVAGRMRTIGFALGPSGTSRGQADRAAPLKGEHTIAVLERHGIGREEIDALLEQGVIHACSPCPAQAHYGNEGQE